MKYVQRSAIYNLLSFLVTVFGLFAGLSSVTSAQGGRTPISTGGALHEGDLIRLLKMHVSPADVGAQARRQHIDFVVTVSAEQELRQAGADDRLLQTLREIQPQGLVWGPPRRVVSSDHGLVDVSNLVTEGGKHYLAFTGDDKRVRLASDASGPWKIYDAYMNSDVGNAANRWYVGLVVHNGAIYIPFVTFINGKNDLGVAYNSNLSGPWSQAALFATDSSDFVNDPFGALSGDTLLVSFDSTVASKGNDDVFVASIPLSKLPAAGAPFTAPLPAQVVNVSKADDMPSGPADHFAEIVSTAGGPQMAWERALKTLVFARGQSGSTGITWPAMPELLHTATDEAQQSLQLAAAGQTDVIARFINNPNPSGPACCDVFATTNATGKWVTEAIGGTNLALQRPGVVVSACGPSVAFQQAIQANPGRLTVATFEGGQWVHQSLAMGAVQPRLTETPDGVDMVYQSGYGDLFLQHAKCYPPPAPAHP